MLTKTAQVNADFRNAIETKDNDALNKVASGAAKPYIKERIYEQSFMSKKLSKRTVKKEELIPGENDGGTGANDTYYVLGQNEMEGGYAVPLNFGSAPEERYLKNNRYRIPLGTHATPIRKKAEQELLGQNYDLFKDIGDKDAFALDALRDDKFIRLCDVAVSYSGRELFIFRDSGTTVRRENGSALVSDPDTMKGLDDLDYGDPSTSAAGEHVVPEFQWFVDAMHLISAGGRNTSPTKDVLQATNMLFHTQVLDDLSKMDRDIVGDELRSRLTINGWAEETINNRTFLASSKIQHLVQRREIINPSTGAGTGKYAYFDVVYLLTDPEFLGEWIEVEGQAIQTEMHREKFTGILEMSSREYFGAAIGNSNAVAKINIFRGIDADANAYAKGTNAISRSITYYSKDEVIAASGY